MLTQSARELHAMTTLNSPSVATIAANPTHIPNHSLIIMATVSKIPDFQTEVSGIIITPTATISRICTCGFIRCHVEPTNQLTYLERDNST